MKYLLSVLLILLIVSCDNEFHAERVDIDTSCQTGANELYLTNNYPKDVAERRKLYFEFAKLNMMNLCDLDSCISSYSITFYEDCNCTRGYIKRQEELRRVESLYERCENYYNGSFLYERSKDNPNVWILTYPKEFKDTIYCK
ncbi:hypothetical protein [Plebeiibacterium marinum]|uniref:Lipoprotein n=1 Tax=Plebeiibacterium marinum TaxID=2992111 RepID=A0AAE3MCF9_9BACT|nr:hypothetical protein [Plebeiobacterium marinum]MCW3805206.1 hypothetical protein [Plebeiobacterium marinum]